MRLALVVLLVAAVLFALHATGEASAWRERAAVQADSAGAWKERAAAALGAFDEARAAHAAERVRGDSLQARLEARTDSVRTRIIVVRDSAPPDPARDRIMDELLTINDSLTVALETALETERAAYASLMTAAMRLRAELTAALERVDSLVAVIEDAPAPPPWWLPRVSTGYGCTPKGCGPSIQLGITLPAPF